ncbi:MAG: hypothetical protein WD070_02310 [Pirellulaceae bacterium]
MRIPADIVEKRRAQLAARKSSPAPMPPDSKPETPVPSRVDPANPEPPPFPTKIPEPLEAAREAREPLKPTTATHELRGEPHPREEESRRPPPLPKPSQPLANTSADVDQNPEHEIPDVESKDIELHSPGYRANRKEVATVRWLAAAILLTGLVGVVPAGIDIVEHSLSQTSGGLSRWACALLLVGVVQCAYAVYLVQLPDWSSVGVVTCVTLAIAAGYAAMFGLTLLSSDQGHFVQLLDLADRLRGGKATAWCLIMLSLMSLTSYFSGRLGVRWRNSFVA